MKICEMLKGEPQQTDKSSRVFWERRGEWKEKQCKPWK